tara:strand:+ start:2244 stop:3455 length:1212 start_codon:yes stop_codon:yes gene_type:complete
MKRIYLDHAATTPMDERVLKAMAPYFTEKYGNASSLHSFGTEAREAVDKAREKVAGILNAESDEIIFNSGGTEGDNMALRGVAYANKRKGKEIITTKIEHHAIEHTTEKLKAGGFEATFLDVNKQGFISLAELERKANSNTILVSVMHANNEIGTIEPIKEIGDICRKKDIYFHTDAVQSVGKEKIDVRKMNIDLLSSSAHKFYGPKGVGFLFVRKGMKIRPIIHGGGHEFGLRSGTENVAGIVGLARALELADKEMERESARERKIVKKIVKETLEIKNSWLNGPEIGKRRLSNNVNLGFDFVEGESMVLMMDDVGIACSTGSACSTKDLSPSHVLLSIGLKPWQAHGSLRLTLGRGTREQDIGYVTNNIRDIVEKLREISPLRKGINIGKYEKGFEEKHKH